MNILRQIPLWVPLIFVALVVWGVHQTREQRVRPRRLVITSAILTALTLANVVSLWQQMPWLWQALCIWAMACAWVSWFFGQGPAPHSTHYDPLTQRLNVAGSWLPLAMYMGIFCCKFAVGVLTASVPDLLHNQAVALFLSAMYGALGGVLNARTLRLLKALHQP